jgi:hypothetical protein
VTRSSAPVRKLPHGRTLEDVIVGSCRDDHREEDIIAELDLIS